MSDITLSGAIRKNLLSLQQTADLMSQTQTRLATGKKVNSALDSPQSFFTAQALSGRATDLGNLLDAMSNGVQTIQAANNGLTSITNLVQQMQATVSLARSDATAPPVTPGTPIASTAVNSSTAVNNNLTFALPGGVSVNLPAFSGTTPASLTGTSGAAATAGSTGNILITSAGINGGAAVSVSVSNGDTLANTKDAINTALAGVSNGANITATIVGGQIQLENSSGNQVALSDSTAGATLAQAGFAPTNRLSSNGIVGAAKTIDELVASINSNGLLLGKVQASNVAGALSLQNLTTNPINVTGMTGGGPITGSPLQTATLGAAVGGGISSVRQQLLTQFNSLRSQLDQLAADSGFNGINLLAGDSLKIDFNENGTSSINVHTADTNGNPFAISSSNIGVSAGSAGQFGDNSQLDTLSTNLSSALTNLRTQASTLSSSLSTTQVRQDFTKAMVTTLNQGADNLTVADINEEGANLLALQTRQQLSTTALSLANQAQQGVLRLFQ